MIRFSFASLGLMEKLIALLSGAQAILPTLSLLYYSLQTPSIHLRFQFIPSLFPPFSFLLTSEREAQVVIPDGSRGMYCLFSMSSACLCQFSFKNLHCALTLWQVPYCVRWDIMSVNKPIPCMGGYHSSGDQTILTTDKMWLNK